MSDLISKLSELRSQYSCFDENERDAYHTLSEAIEALSDKTQLSTEGTTFEAVMEEIKEEYQKAVKAEWIHKPLAKALYEVWKKHNREDVSRHEGL